MSVALTSLLAVDGLAPSSVVVPSSVDELASALRDANERGAAVIPWGAGRHMALGNVPRRYDIALRTTKLDRVIEYEPADLTITVEAGITMGRLQAILAEHGQFLPIDASTDATVSGVLAAGVSGPSRHAYGLPRDWLIGCRLALADGTLVKCGGRVVKNVAGYDMPKLAVGALGTLGVIVEATLKVAPLPAAQETLIVRCDSVAAAAGLVFAADERGLALRAVALRDIEAAFWLAGPAAAVERTARELQELAAAANTERLEGEASDARWTQDVETAPPEGGVEIKASLPPTAVTEFIERLAGLSAVARAYPTTGLVLAHLAPAPTGLLVSAIEQARAAAIAMGGSLVVTSAPVEVKQRLDVWGDVGTALPLMRSLKEQFDPRGTLNPGRYIGGL